jgi:diguanylate cyclase (GGDEF)-like protein/PAS domain S-box-containing protein
MLYPLVDVVIIALVLATLARAPGQHALSLGAAAAGLAVLAATNLTEACLAVVRNHTTLVSCYDVGFVVGLCLVGAGAAIDGARAPRRLVSWVAATQRLLPYLPLPVVLAVAWLHRADMQFGPLILVFVLAMLMVSRQFALSAENTGLLAETQRAMAALAESEQRYRRIVENAAEGMWLSDAHGITRFVNARVTEMLGVGAQDIIGKPTIEVLDAFLDDEARADIQRKMAERASGQSATYEYSIVRGDGTAIHTLVSATPLFDAEGRFEGSLTMISDISTRKDLEDRLVEQARTDALTGLGNRSLLNAVSQSMLSTVGAALVYCDLDGFKAVNDSLGHSTGDILLREVARRLRACLRPGDVIVRLGGDEFAALLPGITNPAAAQAVADRMLEALRDPFPLHGRELYVTASIGIALTEPGAGVDQLLRNADLAMYAAKAGGRGRHRVYERDMHSAMLRRLQLEQDLRRALDNGELSVMFQPVMRLSDSTCVGAEALVRWQHPEHGLLRPDEFIPVAEEAGLIATLDRQVLAIATAEAATWSSPDGIELTLSVNISAQHLMEGSVHADVAAALAVSELAPSRLLVELTERSLLAAGCAQAAVRAVHELGCGIALDDFGTGYSSIAHLREFPVDILKLDRSFVSAITSDPQAGRLVQGILQLAATLGISCTAEGVETVAHARRLTASGCTFAQGYLYAPALTPEDFRTWLAASGGYAGVPAQRTGNERSPARLAVAD